ncbi:MAG TPA: hypothetical protein VF121_05245 [Thermoanaerobaculia bacterium]|nr:hypothetical protein [Thermoanaerobaculia bacterium]
MALSFVYLDNALVSIDCHNHSIGDACEVRAKPDNRWDSLLSSHDCSMTQHSALFSSNGSSLLEDLAPIWRGHLSKQDITDLEFF